MKPCLITFKSKRGNVDHPIEGIYFEKNETKYFLVVNILRSEKLYVAKSAGENKRIATGSIMKLWMNVCEYSVEDINMDTDTFKYWRQYIKLKDDIF